MAVPKRRTTKSKTRIKRNSHYFRTVVQTVPCKKCKAQKLPHAACPECGQK